VSAQCGRGSKGRLALAGSLLSALRSGTQHAASGVYCGRWCVHLTNIAGVAGACTTGVLRRGGKRGCCLPGCTFFTCTAPHLTPQAAGPGHQRHHLLGQALQPHRPALQGLCEPVPAPGQHQADAGAGAADQHQPCVRPARGSAGASRHHPGAHVALAVCCVGQPPLRRRCVLGRAASRHKALQES
jgi:hypothetical protein